MSKIRKKVEFQYEFTFRVELHELHGLQDERLSCKMLTFPSGQLPE
jgi:hypothetical protein